MFKNALLIIYIAFISLLMWHNKDTILEAINNKYGESIEFHPKIFWPENITPIDEQPGPIQNRIMIKADNQGHYRGTALINNVPMPFMIDTGATMISIPIDMAIRAKLPQGKISEMNTANGKAVITSTQLKSIVIGNTEFKNMEANILKKC